MTTEPRFGATTLDDERAAALRSAVRLEWITLGFLVVTVVAVGLVVGGSQAMRTAWIEDMLSFAPPIAFLVAVRIIRRRPTAEHPYGFHRSIGVGHLVAGVALAAMGAFLVIESITTLVLAEHPTVASFEVFGTTVWSGWFMIGVMALTIAPPVIIGRRKLRLADTLHDKLLAADADMNKADWTTAVGSIVGVLGIGLGFWWADAAAALFIAAGILRDGVRNVRTSVLDLVDRRTQTLDGDSPHPVVEAVESELRTTGWVTDVTVRARDEGHVFHLECFVVPRDGRTPSLDQLEEASERCIALDWKVQDLVIVPVRELPGHDGGRRGESQGEPEDERS